MKIDLTLKDRTYLLWLLNRANPQGEIAGVHAGIVDRIHETMSPYQASYFERSLGLSDADAHLVPLPGWGCFVALADGPVVAWPKRDNPGEADEDTLVDVSDVEVRISDRGPIVVCEHFAAAVQAALRDESLDFQLMLGVSELPPCGVSCPVARGLTEPPLMHGTEPAPPPDVVVMVKGENGVSLAATKSQKTLDSLPGGYIVGRCYPSPEQIQLELDEESVPSSVPHASALGWLKGKVEVEGRKYALQNSASDAHEVNILMIAEMYDLSDADIGRLIAMNAHDDPERESFEIGGEHVHIWRTT